MDFNFKEHYRGVISIIGGSQIDQKTWNYTEKIGELLAKNNYIISCGGLTGVMEAVCKGAKRANGLTIGIIPFKDKSAANQYVDIAIPVPFSQARNIIVVLSGDACVAIGGKAGTLSEICFAWIYKKPLIGFSSVDGWSSKMANKKIDDRRTDKIYDARTPKQVIELLNKIFSSELKDKESDFSDIF
ncbi:MAG: TIGR00725 family protein [Promethearchaeota archaeon]|nr:MAG: TIGR00725 family protein [Candidatus Lokiarchaeota archaeon]